MKEKNVILACPACGAKNRIPLIRIDDAPNCGKCKQALPVDRLSLPVDVSDLTFDKEVMASPIPVLVDCWAPWCGPCRAFAPVIDDLARQYRGRLKVAKLNLDNNTGTGARFSITSVPTILLVKGGRVIDTLAGAYPKEQLEQHIARVL